MTTPGSDNTGQQDHISNSAASKMPVTVSLKTLAALCGAATASAASKMPVTVSLKTLAALCGAATASFWRGKNAHVGATCPCRYCVAIREAREVLADAGRDL